MGGWGADAIKKTRDAATGRNQRADPKKFPAWSAFLAFDKPALQAVRQNPGLRNADAKAYSNWVRANRKPAVPNMPNSLSPGDGGGGGGRGYGGGGGGGGAAAPDLHAQEQMDLIMQLLGSDMYKAKRDDAGYAANEALRGGIRNASQADQATGSAAWDRVDQYIAANRRNPYDDVKLQRARVAPDQNAWLTSQGAEGLNQVTENPEDPYSSVFNVLQLLSANNRAGDISRGAESQFGRADTTNRIAGMDNAYLFGVDARDAQLAADQTKRQETLDAEKRQTIAQLIALIEKGAAKPDLSALGIV